MLAAKMIEKDFSHKIKILADVGTDHAKLPIYMVAKSCLARAYASDLRPGPLMKAEENVSFYLGDRASDIKLILGDGTENIPHDYNYLSIMGMGGDMISEIIEKTNAADNTVFILSPMTNAEKLRKYLYDNGFVILEEDLAKEDRKIYTVIKACKGESPIESIKRDELEIYFSKALIRGGSPYLKEYVDGYILKAEKAINGRLLSGRVFHDIERFKRLRDKMKELEKKL